MDATLITLAFCGIAAGGVLKGATGAGAPLVGVPVLAVVFDVPMAVAIFSVLNIVSNSWQAKTFYHEITDRRFAWTHAATAAIGVVPGSVLLATLPTEVLMASMAAVVFLYIGLRISTPNWQMTREQGRRFGPILGFVGGRTIGAGFRVVPQCSTSAAGGLHWDDIGVFPVDVCASSADLGGPWNTELGEGWVGGFGRCSVVLGNIDWCLERAVSFERGV